MQIKEVKEKSIRTVKRRISYAPSGITTKQVAPDVRAALSKKKEAALPVVEDFLNKKQKRKWERLSEPKKQRILRRMENSTDYRKYQEAIIREEGIDHEKKKQSYRFSGSSGKEHPLSETSYGREDPPKEANRRQTLGGWQRQDTEGPLPYSETGPALGAYSQKSLKTEVLQVEGFSVSLLGASVLRKGADGVDALSGAAEGIHGVASDAATGGITAPVRYGFRAVKKAAKTFRTSMLQKEEGKRQAAKSILAASSVTGASAAVFSPADGARGILARALAFAAAMVSAIVQAALIPILVMTLAAVLLFAAVFGTLIAAISGFSGGGNSAYLSWAVSIAEDDSHGYSQGQAMGYASSRTGPDYDCSSFVYYALLSAGYEMPGYAFTTASMPSILTGLGFEQLPYTGMADLLPGDILWVHGDAAQHTEIYMGDGQLVGAACDLDGYQAGDQSGTGNEIRVGGFYEDGWMGVFRDPNYGIGDIAIPEEYEGMPVGWIFSCTPHYGSWNWAYGPGRVHAAWVEAGAVYSENVAMIDDKYLIACTETFGEIGDWVTFYFEDGTAIETIIADRKSEHDSTWTPWGHIHGNQIDVIEAETLLTINPGQTGCVESWGGHRVVSATNHGAFI